jgi:hypothetical protein
MNSTAPWRSISLKLGRFAVGWWTKLPPSAGLTVWHWTDWIVNIRLWCLGITILCKEAYWAYQNGDYKTY